MSSTLAEFVDAGRLKIFSLNHNASESFYNKGAHPYHRSWMQRMYDEYVREEVVPFVWSHCQGQAPKEQGAGPLKERGRALVHRAPHETGEERQGQ